MRTAPLEFLVLAATWGASFLFMRIAAPEFGPLPMTLLRCGIAALSLLPLLLLHGRWRTLRANAGWIGLVGLINSALPFALLAYASLTLTAGTGSILNSLAPLWTAIIAFLWFGDRLSVWQQVGLICGIVGVAILAGGGGDAANALPDGALWRALGAAVLATAAYGVGANLARRRLRGVDPLVIATGSQVSATLALLVPGTLLWPHALVADASLIGSMLALGTLCTGVAYILFFRLIAGLGATRAVGVTFVIPVFGLLWGHVFLDEAIHAHTVLGAAVIVLGTALTTGILRPTARAV